MYVMIYCATMLKGPHQCWQVPDDFKAYSSVPMKEWFGLDGLERSYASMAQMKTGHTFLEFFTVPHIFLLELNFSSTAC